MNKFIFLDIDGVLNSLEFSVSMNSLHEPSNYITCDIDPIKLGLIKTVWNYTDAKIIISSSWRIGRETSWFLGLFEGLGWSNAPIIDRTPCCPNSTNDTRGDEIQYWLDNNKDKTGEEYKYVIFDDDVDFHSDQPHIKCDGVIGLSIRQVVKAIDMLGSFDEKKDKTLNQLRLSIEYNHYVF